MVSKVSAHFVIMSSCYTLSHVLEEVLAEKARVRTISRGQTTGAKVEIYSESWGSLNAWIESRLCKRKGANVPMLGSFTWEVKYGGDGSVFSRPIFIMSDSFIKDHRIRRQRIHAQPNLIPAEEINYSQLAIKFSRTLTKDMISSGTRDIMKKIGDFIDRGYEFEIEFAFGTLKSKEKTVRFEFNQARLAAILPENLRIGTMPQNPISYNALSESEMSETSSNQYGDREVTHSSRPVSVTLAPRRPPSIASSSSSALFEYPRASSAPEASVDAMAQMKPQSQRLIPPLALPAEHTDTEPSSPHTHALSLSLSKSITAPLFANTATLRSVPATPEESELSGTFSAEASEPLFPSLDRPVSPGLQAVLMSLEERKGPVNKTELRNIAKARVEEAAYLRELEKVDGEAVFEEATQQVARRMLEDHEALLKAKIDSFHEKKSKVKSLLDAQIHEVEERNRRDKQERLAGKAAFFLPDSAGCIDNPPGCLSGGPNYKTIRQSLFNDLTYQINSNAARTMQQKQQVLEEERDYLDHVAMELDLQNIAERVSHLETQKSLLASWERDAHIRNLRKLQVAGSNAIQDYIYVNLPQAAAAAETKKASMYSVGYDYRKGKQ